MSPSDHFLFVQNFKCVLYIFHKTFFYMSLAMALSVIVLNRYLIGLIGINGAALATLIVVFIYSFIKIFYIKSKLNMQPFSLNTVKIVLIVSVVFFLFYFWNFNLNPILNMLLKGILITVFYLLLINKFKISQEVNNLLVKSFKK